MYISPKIMPRWLMRAPWHVRVRRWIRVKLFGRW